MTNKTTSRNRRQARALRDRADAESVVKRRRADRSATWPSTNKYKVTANHDTTRPVSRVRDSSCASHSFSLASPLLQGGCIKTPSHRVALSTPEEPRFLEPAPA